MTFAEILEKTQAYISQVFSSEPEPEMLESYVRHFVKQNHFANTSQEEDLLCEELLDEMQGFSILSPYLKRDDIEEINVNRWDDVKITHTNGITLPGKHFLSPHHAVDIIKRLLLQSNMVWDNSQCIQVGHLAGNIRVTAVGFDIVDEDAACAVSIRKITASNLSREDFIAGKTCNEEMIDFLREAYKNGVSICIAGSAGSGKTTLMSYILKHVPTDKRLLTVEQGTREFDCVCRGDDDTVKNNVVHLQTRLSDDERHSITQEKLLETMMTMNPDYIAVGESKGAEAMQAINAANTGHAVITTTHANSCEDTYFRLVSLCKIKYPNMDEELLTHLAVRAFPITVYMKKLKDNSRRILKICEAEYADGQIQMKELYRFQIEKNAETVQGFIQKSRGVSNRLSQQMTENGIDKHWMDLFQKEC